jgi:signal transduction histidine kinase
MRVEALGLAIAVIAVGVVVLAGWLLDIERLTSLSTSFASMKPNTAIGFVLVGLALLEIFLPENRRRRIGSLACAGAAAAIGGLTLIEYAFSADLGIDELVFGDVADPVKTSSPGRMALLTAVVLLLLGGALALRQLRPRPAWPWQALTTGALVTAFVALMGYLYGVEGLYGAGDVTRMAVHTSATTLLAGIALLLSAPTASPISVFANEGPAGTIARRLVPAVLVGIPLIGWLRDVGQSQGLYGTAVGLALMVTIATLTLTLFAIDITASLARSDAERTRAEAERERALFEVRRLAASLEQRVEQRTREFERANRALQASNKDLEAFSYSVSHDLRAPLRAIEGFGRILDEEHAEELADEAHHCVERIRFNVGKMAHLVDDLLEHSRVSRQTLEPRLVRPEPMVRSLLEMLVTEADRDLVEVEIGTLPACHADPRLLDRIFANLLDNALKFSLPRDHPRIQVSGYRDGDTTVYVVEDNGVGFDLRYADKLFAMFQRLHRADEFEGTGVGLAIVARAVDRHDGRVWATSGEGATRFSFSVPDSLAPDQGGAARPYRPTQTEGIA